MSESVKLQKDSLQDLWEAYSTTKDPAAKDALLLHYMGLVRAIVLRMLPTYQEYVEFDDLLSCGVLGLMDALNKFDLTQGVKFESYAAVRIRGEIIDQIRKSDWAPSSLRRKINHVQTTSEKLEAEYSRSPSEEEIAKAAGYTTAEVHDLLEKSYMFNLIHFEDMLNEAQSLIPANRMKDENPEAAAEGKELLDTLSSMIRGLTERERTVVSLYYFEEMTLKDIASVLGVTESRVSQIHSKVLLKLRSQLQQSFDK